MTTTTTEERVFVRDRRVHVKVKIKSLAEEAKIIRKEEKKSLESSKRTRLPDEVREWKSWEWMSLQEHRTGVVRYEARHAQLAYAFLRGRKYRRVEQTTRSNNKPDLHKLVDLVARFGSIDDYGYSYYRAMTRFGVEKGYKEKAEKVVLKWLEEE